MAIQLGRHRRGQTHTSRNGGTERLANALGWFSIGLGITEIAAPGFVSKLIGIEKEDKRGLMRLCGFREVAAGVGILAARQPSNWLWGRVGGDLLDLATLGSVMRSDDSNRTRVAMTTAAVLGVTALDVYCGQELSRKSQEEKNIRVKKTIIVNRSPEELYSFWREFEKFPTFIDHLESVEVMGEGRSHWKAKLAAGTTVEWDSEIVEDRPNSLISWRSVEGSEIDNSGSVQFERATGGRGTVIRLELEYAPIGGRVGANIAKLLGAEPGQQVESALRRMKQLLETGGIVRSEASIHRRMHPACPPQDEGIEDLDIDENRITTGRDARSAGRMAISPV